MHACAHTYARACAHTHAFSWLFPELTCSDMLAFQDEVPGGVLSLSGWRVSDEASFGLMWE